MLDGLKTLVETGSRLPDVEDGASVPVATDAEGEWHRSMGIAANNGTWEWLGKDASERTAAENEAMTASAYAASISGASVRHEGSERRYGPAR